MQFLDRSQIRYTQKKIIRFLKEVLLYPSFQRPVDQDYVNILKNSFTQYFLPMNFVVICIFNKKQYIIDGQHRCAALKLISHLEHLGKIPICEITVNSFAEMEQIFKIVNNQKPLESVYKLKNMDDKKMILETVNFFKEKYNYFFKYNGKRRPFLSEARLLQCLTDSLEDLEETTSTGLIEKIEKLNLKYSNKPASWFPSKGKTKNEKIFQRIHTPRERLYLGMFNRFEWVDHLNTQNLPTKVFGTNSQLSNALRNAVWNKYIGIEKGESKCICCRKISIYQQQFECGHVQARSLGGPNSVENLRPICKACNTSMGTTNMKVFMKQNNFGKLKYH